MKNTTHNICFIHLGKTHDDLPLIMEKLKQKSINSVLINLDDVEKFDFNTIDLISLRHCRGYHLDPDFMEKLNQLKKSVSQVQNKAISIINPLNIASDTVDKNLYLKWLENEGVKLIPTLWLSKQQKITLNEIVQKTQWTDFVIKPTISSKSWQTYRVLKLASGKFKVTSTTKIISTADAENIFDQLLTSFDVCIQKFIPEILTSGETSFVFIGGNFSHAISKTVSKSGWIAHEFFGGRNQSITANIYQVNWATAIYNKLVTRYGDLAYARIDGIYNSNKQLQLLECELLVPRLFLVEAKKLDQYIDSITKAFR